MQAKVLVKIFTLFLIAISLYELSYTVVVKNYEKKVKQEATAYVDKNYPSLTRALPKNPEKQILYRDTLNNLISAEVTRIEDSTADQIVFNSGIEQLTYQKLKGRELNLGLDLQGGMNVVLEVSLQDLIRSMASHSTDPAFNKALQLATQRKTTSSSDFVTLFGEAYEEVAPNGRLAPIFSNAFQSKINYSSSNADVLKVIRAEARDAIQRTYIVLQQRIDEFGVSQPNINLDLNKGIISVELAGIQNKARVEKYLQATAKLEFWETYELNENFMDNILKPMNQAIANSLSGSSSGVKTDSSQLVAKLGKSQLAKKDTSTANSLKQFIKNAPTQPGATMGNSAEAKANPLFAILKQSTTGRPAIGAIAISDTAKFNSFLQL
ncbi:MAG: protein translocase subunit SecDF, partial [Chitinophagaceae bacterium]